jgi:hypothetical protein
VRCTRRSGDGHVVIQIPLASRSALLNSQPLAAVSRDVAYALSGQGALARTDDGGQQWIQLLPAAAPTGQLDAVSETTAFGAQDATDAGAVLRSGNGGRSWYVIAQLPGVITQLDFPSAADGVAVTFQSAGTWQLWLSRDSVVVCNTVIRWPGSTGETDDEHTHDT